MGQWLVSYSGTWPKISRAVLEHNKGTSSNGGERDLKRELRLQHERCLQECVRLYSRQVARYKLVQFSSDNIPPLYTNRVALAGRLGVSPRTIANLIGRLIEAGMILSKTFRGSNEDFALHLNPQLLDIRAKVTTMGGNTDTATQDRPGATANGHEAKGRSGASMRAGQTPATDVPAPHFGRPSKHVHSGKSLPHQRDTFIQKNTINDSWTGVDKETGDATLREKETGDTAMQESVGGGLDTKTQTKKRTGGAAGRDLEISDSDVQNGREMPSGPQFEDFRARLIALAMAHLFDQLDYMSESQYHALDDFILASFWNAAPDDWQAVYGRIAVRMMLAGTWRRKKPGRYIPPPATYFAPGGMFARTERWLERVQMRNETVQAHKQKYNFIIKQYGAFCTAVARWMDDKGIAEYSSTRRKLAGSYFALDRAFDYMVTQFQ